MVNQTSTISIPKWAKERALHPVTSVGKMLKTLAFLKMKEYERQIEVFREKRKSTFSQFEKKVTARKKEDPEAWDDYIVWKGLEAARDKWQKRYNEL